MDVAEARRPTQSPALQRAESIVQLLFSRVKSNAKPECAHLPLLYIGFWFIATRSTTNYKFDVLTATVALAGGFGCLFGAVVGVIIGQGVTSEDAYVYAESTQRGGAVLAVTTRRVDRASVEARLLKQSA